MSESLTAQLINAGFFRYANNEDSKALQEEFSYGNIWSMYDERIGRFFDSDSEDLAEYGIKSFIDEVAPYLRKQGVITLDVTEDGYDDGNYYNVTVNGKQFKIWDDPNDEQSWGKATFATFNIINMLLKQAGSSEQIYAQLGGNELNFIFLTDAQYRLLMQFQEAKDHPHEMPYLMVDSYPNYGIAERPAIKRSSIKSRYIKWLPVLVLVAFAKYYLYTTHQKDFESMYTLKLDRDFTVISNQLPDTSMPLTWVITENGKTVLERNADNELAYRYYRLQQGVTYTVRLKAPVNGSYHDVSNTISFTP